ncbi:metal ABC transporter ATP-binding protein [Acidiphilium sp. PA]|uniref:metal ABC transporter ATP-binding protein n=1 Tax=Acidiphilium sp. PA TaxID=2871705 RepID=UPI0022448189|nr:metal ABC transporter ATP-binding protein [Acidiphilium sp. PA]MCW8306349.1 metal ABC transporter ATP-binding protein [Acidiphilium sp. PA]
MLTLSSISVAFAGRTILHNVDFTLAQGSFCGLIGSNGSGKTTLLRTILGLVKPDRGTVDTGGHEIGYVPQKIQLDPFMPLRARDVVALGLDGNRFGLPLPSAARRRTVDAMLTAVDATGFADRRVGDLSGGQQQRIMIAHALVRRPKLLLLDEPLANLDLRSVAEVVSLLHTLSFEQRITVLLSAHDMNPLLPVMDRIVYLANGSSVSGTVGEVVRGAVLSRLYGYHIDVIRVHGRVLVVAAGGEDALDADAACEPVHVTQIR